LVSLSFLFTLKFIYICFIYSIPQSSPAYIAISMLSISAAIGRALTKKLNSSKTPIHTPSAVTFHFAFLPVGHQFQ